MNELMETKKQQEQHTIANGKVVFISVCIRFVHYQRIRPTVRSLWE